MRRQATIAGVRPVNGIHLRLDPLALPVRYQNPLAGTASEAESLIHLDRTRVLIKRTQSGVPITLTLPIKNFLGIAARFIPLSRSGSVRVIVELAHTDPALSLPLAITEDPEGMADDWHAWGEALGLPLLIVNNDGSYRQPAVNSAAIEAGGPAPRRRRAFLRNRRPRFAMRRKLGGRRPAEILAGREIIARN